MEPIVICWWGSELRILGPMGDRACRVPAAVSGAVAAVLEIVSAEPVRPKRARVLYQPDGMEVRDVDCGSLFSSPRGRGIGRRAAKRRLRRSLAAEFPALAHPGTCFCLWPALAPDAGRVTLHFEARSRLPGLVNGLASAGLRVEGAWPLCALSDETAGGPSSGWLDLAASGGRAHVSWVIPGGDAGAENCAGECWADTAAAALRSAVARFDDAVRPPGRFAVESGPAAATLRDTAAGLGLSETTLADFLGAARRLPLGTRSDFLPCSPWRAGRISRRRIAGAMGLAAIVSAAGYGWVEHRRHERWRLEIDDQAARRSHIREESAAAAALSGRITRLSAELAEAEIPPQRHYELLAAIARCIPRTAVLCRLSTDGREFMITGRILEGPALFDATLAGFREGLAASEPPWVLRRSAEPTPAPDFTVAGTFKADEARESPEGPVPQPGGAAAVPKGTQGANPEDPARLAARLAATRARFPSAAEFDSGRRPWGSRWVVTGRSVEARSDWEIRHLALAWDRPGLRDWPDIADAVRSCCSQPGLTIDRLALIAAPDGADSFLKAELSLAVRLRR